jgi:two-component system cell cycle sensor histidine kinase PleC
VPARKSGAFAVSSFASVAGEPQKSVQGEPLAGDLAQRVPSHPARTSCGEIFEWFRAHGEVPAVAILDDSSGEVLALVNRLLFFARYAQQYAPELYSKKSILKLANLKPLVVDAGVPVAEVGARLLEENPDALVECFVVTKRGRYFGVGTGEALLRSKVDLLQTREQELSRALASETAANRAKSDFLALMSHELRTPLNAIIGFSEVLGSEMLGPLGHARYREYAHDVHGAGRHLLALINDILDLSKAEAGKFDLTEEEIITADLVAECIKLMRGRAQEGGLRLTHDIAPNMPNLVVDRLRLKQVLLNLLSNAIKFTPRGGKVDLTAGCDGEGRPVLSVRDTGIGMAPETIPAALEPFKQISSPFARNVEGTGLGLALVKSLIECHGGMLEIESALNEGTQARLVLPVSRAIRKRNALYA